MKYMALCVKRHSYDFILKSKISKNLAKYSISKILNEKLCASFQSGP